MRAAKEARIDEIRDLLAPWGADGDYTAASGMRPDDNPPVDDELEAIGAAFPHDPRRMLLDVMLADPKTLRTYDATLGDSIPFDDLKTPAIETRDERILASLRDALAFLDQRLGPDRGAWRWGRLHTIASTRSSPCGRRSRSRPPRTRTARRSASSST